VNSLRLVCAGVVLNNDLQLLQDLLQPSPFTNRVFVVFQSSQARALPHLISALPSSAALRTGSAATESSALSADAADGDYICRICHGDGPAADFIHPCACSGSMGHVHAACLSRWRSIATNISARTRCEQCNFHYRITQQWWVQYLLAPSFIAAYTSIVLAFAVTASGFVINLLSDYVMSWLLLPPDADFKFLISGCFGLGAVSFCHLVHMRFSWIFFRGGALHINWHSLLLTLLPLLALQDMTIRVIIALGCLHAVTHTYCELRSSAMRFCSAHGEQILNVENSE
jgi:hypothetical protein